MFQHEAILSLTAQARELELLAEAQRFGTREPAPVRGGLRDLVARLLVSIHYHAPAPVAR